MKITNHNGDEIRQIIPQDMSFLSDADQQIVAAMQGILCSMFGISSDKAIVVNGMKFQYKKANASLVDKTYIITVGEGSMIYNGRLYNCLGGSITIADFVPGSSLNKIALELNESNALPAVYGESLTTNVQVHIETVATLKLASQVSDGSISVLLSDVMTIPVVDSAIPIFGTNTSVQ